MKSGIWNTICLSIACIGIVFCATVSQLSAQDDFREFDRKMVATPAELFKALSGLHPTEEQQRIDSQRLEELGKAGLEILNGLPPEKQDKLWEFAAEHLRKNGADSASSKKLMEEFGLPPHMQNELTKQLRRFSNRSPSSNSQADDDSRDAISQLLQKAREKIKKGDLQDGTEGAKQVSPSDRTMPATDSEGLRNRTDQSADSGRNRSRDGDRSNSTSENPRTESQQRSDSRSGQRSDGRSTSGSDSGNRSKPTMGRNRPRGQPTNSDEELEKLREQIQAQQQVAEQARKIRKSNGEPGLNDSGSTDVSDLDLKKVIEDLAEKDGNGAAADLMRQLNQGLSSQQNRTNGNGAGKAEANKSMFDRAKGFFSGALDSKKKSEGSGGQNGSGSKEKVGTRFDRLLVKAVDRTLDRTLESQNEKGVSDGVSSVLGNLIERFKDRDKDSKKQSDQARDSRRGGRGERKSRRQQDRASANQNRAQQNANNQGERSSRSSNDWSSSAPEPQTPNVDSPNFNPRSMLDQIPDLSSINPAHIFMFFGIVGVLLLVGYFLTQSIAGEEGSSKRKRDVIKRVRNTTIKTPKDLVETVDMFLLAKFGIKSSWWNATLAKRVLDSGSPELKPQVDELFRDYVRARYMRNDVPLPEADQSRFKRTLEELSKLDIKPDSNLGFVPTKPAVSLEG